MDERYLKWGLMIPAGLLLFSLLVFIVYLLVPADIQSVKSVLALAMMLGIIIGAVSVIIPIIIATIEVAGSNRISGLRKAAWIILFWISLLLGIIVVIIYYFVDRKNTI